MTMKAKPRLGRGLSSLISISDAPEDVPASAGPGAGAAVVSRSLPTEPASSGSAPVAAPGPSAFNSLPQPPRPTSIGSNVADDSAASPSGSLIEVPIDRIVPNPHQPRRQMNEGSIAELAASLKSTGVIQPIIVRIQDGKYQLIAGERRWRAARLAGLATIPAIVRDTSAFEQAQMALVENIQRENLNPIDRAQAYRTLMSQLGLTQAELAGRMGEDRSSIANYLRLLDLAGPVQAMVVDRRLSMGHAKILAGVSDMADQERLANLVVNQSLSVRNLERQLQDAPPVSTRLPAPLSPHIADLEKSLARQLGMRVQVRAGAKQGQGKLILHYATLDQFDEVLNRLGLKSE
jgi:ParB family chromosome partitioning protein